MTGPRRPDEPDGPELFFLLLIDNGRAEVLGGEYAESLACIRCGACLNACPVYQNVGGHSYGWVYPGPIGSIVTPLLQGLKSAPQLPYASSLCGACQQACPVDIHIPDMLLKLRRDLVREQDPHNASAGWRAAMALWRTGMRSPALYRLGGFAAGALTRLFARAGVIRKLPGPLAGWTANRDFPAFPRDSFRARYRARMARHR
jgi:L-lactate dehydrogenase complex protein LldF